MKSIPLKEAYDLLAECTAIIIDDYALMYPGLQELDEDEFLILSWEDEGEEYIYEFYSQNNQMVKVDGSAMYLYDQIGTCIRLSLLTGMLLE